MANLTLTLDDRLLLRVRQRALEHGTSVEALVLDYLQGFAGEDEARDAGWALADLAARSTGSSGPAGRRWTRDELHDR